MKIKTKLQIVAILPVLFFLAASAIQFVMSSKIEGHSKKEDIASDVYMATSDLISLTYEYGITSGERARIQWNGQYKNLEAHLNEMVALFEMPAEKNMLEDIRRNHKDAGRRFSELEGFDAEKKSERTTGTFLGVRNNMVNSLILELQEILPMADKLHDISHAEAGRLGRYSNIVTGFLSFMLILCIPPILLIIVKRITSPLDQLHNGMRIIASGDLQHRVSVDSKDEIGSLTIGFNEMAGRLREITVSRDELSGEIEERIQTEKALHMANAYNRSLIEASLDPLVTIGPDGRITDVNAATQEATGYSEEELINNDFSKYFSDPEKAAAGYRKVFIDGFVRDYELQLRHRDGHTIPVLYNASVFRNEAGEVTGVFAAARDITERKKIEEEIGKLNQELEQRVSMRTADLQKTGIKLQESQRALMNIVEDLNQKTEELERANRALEAVNRELEAFSYSVSHDLRAPLRAIDGFSQAVLEDYGKKLGGEGGDYLRRIRAASQRMGHLIDDILNLSRLGRFEMFIEDVDLSFLARTIAGELQGAHPDRSVEVVVQEGVRARGDARLLRIALENLLDNAWKFSGRNSCPKIEFGCLPEGGRDLYFVRDNGVGFDMAYSDKLFSPFQRLHSAQDFPGTGIGLATVWRIITRHKGRIWTESGPGRGATFYFTL